MTKSSLQEQFQFGKALQYPELRLRMTSHQHFATRNSKPTQLFFCFLETIPLSINTTLRNHANCELVSPYWNEVPTKYDARQTDRRENGMKMVKGWFHHFKLPMSRRIGRHKLVLQLLKKLERRKTWIICLKFESAGTLNKPRELRHVHNLATKQFYNEFQNSRTLKSL